MELIWQRWRAIYLCIGLPLELFSLAAAVHVLRRAGFVLRAGQDNDNAGRTLELQLAEGLESDAAAGASDPP